MKMAHLLPAVVAVAVVAIFMTSSSASQVASSIPQLEETRITAEYGRHWAFVPSWVPPGFQLHFWAVDGGSAGFLLDRLRLRFRRGPSDLIWEVASGHPGETADRATCERSRPSRRIRGREVYRVGDDTAYVCISAKGPFGNGLLAVSVREVTFSSEVEISQLQKRSAYFPRTAYARFGRNGRRLQWTVAPSGSGFDDSCPRSGPRHLQPAAVISGRRVYLIQGAKGQSAWICVSKPKQITVEMWNDYSVSAKTLMRVVGSARE